jgi:hypothetical protein
MKFNIRNAQDSTISESSEELSLANIIDNGYVQVNYKLKDGTPIKINSATSSQVDELVNIINEAYLADAYFKKPNMSDRTSASEIVELIEKQATTKSAILCCYTLTDELVGTFYLDIQNDVCDFGLLAVCSRFKGLGYGSVVLNEIVVTIAKYFQCTCIELLSINPAAKLREWYKNECGFEIIHRVDAPPCVLEIALDPSFVYFWKMRKQIHYGSITNQYSHSL